MTEAEMIDRLLDLAQKATPGPWDRMHVNRAGQLRISESTAREVDWRFISAARDAVPAMCAEVKRLRDAVEQEREACAQGVEAVKSRVGYGPSAWVLDAVAAAIRARGTNHE